MQSGLLAFRFFLNALAKARLDDLSDGALDYCDAVLERFDFVVASVHSRFKMDRESLACPDRLKWKRCSKR